MMVTPSVKLVRPLGEGGMGAVWVADHLSLRIQVVVKFIAHGLANNRDAQTRFSREAAAAAQVKSPHVVQTFDHGISDSGIPYIVMELLEGQDLGARLETQTKLLPAEVIEIVTQLARALERAHEKGIVHRDIKPGNVFLCDTGRANELFIKLLDFGIAKGVDILHGVGNSTTKTGSMIGSPFYMSPEQILGSKDLDYRSDLWSLGVLTFEMLTGKKPFDAGTMGGLAIKIHSEALPSALHVDPALPVAFDAWFEKACARDLNERFSSARALAESLRDALETAPVPSTQNARRLISLSPGVNHVDSHASTLAASNALAPISANPRSPRVYWMIAGFALLAAVAYAGRVLLGHSSPKSLVVSPLPSAETRGQAPLATVPPIPAAVSDASAASSSAKVDAHTAPPPLPRPIRHAPPSARGVATSRPAATQVAPPRNADDIF
jgi:serine/threonine-protein kinase